MNATSATLPSMSPQLSTRCALALLGAMLFASLMGLLAWGPVGYPAATGRNTDPRAVLGLAQGWNVLSLLPLFAASVAGAVGLQRRGADGPRRAAWRLFFGAATLATVAGGFDHLAPGDTGFLLAQVVTASVCALLSLIYLAERLGPRWVAPGLLAAAVASGPLGGLACAASAAWLGGPDLRWLLWLEFLPMLLVPLGVWGLRSVGLGPRDWTVALLWFAAAKLFDGADGWVWQVSGGAIGGHVVNHLLLAGCVGWLAWRVLRQRADAPLATPEETAAEPAASQRAASLTTSG